MGHSYYKNYGHLVYHVKNVCFKTSDLPDVHDFLLGELMRLGGKSIVIGGIEDHVHILCDFPITRTIPDVVQRIKAHSSAWIKHKHPSYARFAWQTGYAFFSVSASQYNRVSKYIQGQREHHFKENAEQEYRRLLVKHGIEIDPHDDIWCLRSM